MLTKTYQLTLNVMLKISIFKATTNPNAEQIKCSALTFPEAARLNSLNYNALCPNPQSEEN